MIALHALKERLTMRFIALVVRNCATLRNGYLATIEERNALLTFVEQQTAVMESVSDEYAELEAVTKLAMASHENAADLLLYMNTLRARGEIQIVIEDPQLRAGFNLKVINLHRAITAQPSTAQQIVAFSADDTQGTIH